MAFLSLRRQFFVGTEVEYLPLALVRDTCAVKISRREDVHSKQKLGDLPKPLRWECRTYLDPAVALLILSIPVLIEYMIDSSLHSCLFLVGLAG